MSAPSPMPEVLVEHDGAAVYVTWDRGPTWRLGEDGTVAAQYRPAPELPDELLDLADVIGRIASVKLSKAARTALAAAFGVHVDDLAHRW